MDKKQQDLYSRQIGTFGESTMKQIANTSVYVIGLDNIGLETCKCLCLIGIKKLYIYDKRLIDKKTLGCNFIINDIPDESKTIDNSCLDYLKELNSYVDIECVKTIDIIDEIIKKIDILIVSQILNSISLIKLDKKCKQYSAKFIIGLSWGFSGYVFSNFLNHTIKDNNGENLRKTHVLSINYNNNKTILDIHDKTMFTYGDCIEFTCKKNDYFKIHGFDGDKLIINKDLSDLKLENSINLQILEVKEKFIRNYRSLEEVIADRLYPDSVINLNNPEKTMNLLDDFYRIIKSNKIDNLNNKVIVTDNYSFPVIGSILGSLIATEVIKLGGKYLPLDQEILIDYSELYQLNNSTNMYKTIPDLQYKNIYGLLSKNIIKYLKTANIFLVGSGALGCEYLKLFHMLAISTQKNSKKRNGITITDMDKIELSNLNRQFLFRNSDIGKLKSETAAKKITGLNKEIKIRALEYAVGSDTEQFFDTHFWERQDIIVNALDNINARQYVDKQCVLHNKPLFEAGTLGVKSNVQVIIPCKTATYSDTIDPPDKEIPVCTLKHFPFKIEHCVLWSLDIFNTYFNDFINDITAFLKGKENFTKYLSKIDNKEERLDNLVNFLDCYKREKESFYIISIFETHFISQIKQILKDNPKDKLDDSGNKFWSGIRLLPKIIDLKKNNLLSDFVNYFGQILGRCIGKKILINDNLNVLLNDYKTFSKLSINDDSKKIDYIYSFKINIGPVNIECFEKDNDMNSHIDFIKAASNLRAHIYGINKIDFINCKLIAGKITPALSTTTTMVTALSIMELLKYVYNKLNQDVIVQKKIKYMDIFLNMGINMYIQSGPKKPLQIVDKKFNNLYGCHTRTIPESFTTWDSILLSRKNLGILNISDMLAYFKDKFNISLDMISSNAMILYSRYNDNLNYSIKDVYTKLKKTQLDIITFEVSAFKDDVPVVFPKIVYDMRK